ncbi:MAG: SDR family oxidoreductase [Turneriella sp.]|nr:SDR family oxidoreductase [Turneriella sp.]
MVRGAALSKIALVTGASKGLGLAVARGLSTAGYYVILNARNRTDLAAALKTLPGPGVVLAADAADPQFAEALGKIMQKENLPHLDVVVHSAAINHMGTVAETKPENAAATFHANTLSVISLARAVRAHLEKSRQPRFVFVSSLMKYFAMPGRSVYAASKAAAEQIVLAWAHELAAEKSLIRVQVFRPAGINTGFHSNTKTDGVSPRSDVSRMDADKAAGYLLALVQSNRAELAPGFMNKVVAFVARHFPAISDMLVQRRYLRRRQQT